MKRLAIAALAGFGLLTACTGKPTTGPSTPGAMLALNLAPARPLSQQAAFRIMAAAATQSVTDFTPTMYKQHVVVSLFKDASSTSNGNPAIFEGDLDLADAKAVAAALSKPLSVLAGTYQGVHLQLGDTLTIQGQGTIGGVPFYSKASTASSTTTSPAEAVAMTRHVAMPYDVFFSAPLTIKDGDTVKLNLLYDLTNTLMYYNSGHPTDYLDYADHTGISRKTLPIVAYVGDVPTPEIYKVTVSDRDHDMAADSHWHFDMVVFPGSGNDIASCESIGRVDDGFLGGDFAPTIFINSQYGLPDKNGDGTYHFLGGPDHKVTVGGMQENRSFYDVPAFKRATHDGVLTWYNWTSQTQDPGATPSATMSYHCEKIQ